MNLIDAAYVMKMALIASHLSGYAMPTNAPPRVFEVTELEMGQHCHCTNDAAMYQDGGDIFINVEYLNGPQNGNSIAHSSENASIIHELTHWLQYEHAWGGDYSCDHVQARENEAYRVEQTYLIQYEPKNLMIVMPPDICSQMSSRPGHSTSR